jgi:hypothetical protein
MTEERRTTSTRTHRARALVVDLMLPSTASKTPDSFRVFFACFVFLCGWELDLEDPSRVQKIETFKGTLDVNDDDQTTPAMTTAAAPSAPATAVVQQGKAGATPGAGAAMSTAELVAALRLALAGWEQPAAIQLVQALAVSATSAADLADAVVRDGQIAHLFCVV